MGVVAATIIATAVGLSLLSIFSIVGNLIIGSPSDTAVIAVFAISYFMGILAICCLIHDHFREGRN